ncbi:hypothetical protein MIDIC_10033 [Alphaproteobacteria bacterium]
MFNKISEKIANFLGHTTECGVSLQKNEAQKKAQDFLN